MKRPSPGSGFDPLPPFGRSTASCRASRPLRQSRQGGGRLRSAKFLFTPPATPLPALPAPPARSFSKHPLRRAAREQRCRHAAARADGGVADAVKARSASVKAHIAQRCDAGTNRNLAERSRPPPSAAPCTKKRRRAEVCFRRSGEKPHRAHAGRWVLAVSCIAGRAARGGATEMKPPGRPKDECRRPQPEGAAVIAPDGSRASAAQRAAREAAP